MSLILSLGRDAIVAFTSGSQRYHIVSWQSQVESASNIDMRFTQANNKDARCLTALCISTEALPVAKAQVQDQGGMT